MIGATSGSSNLATGALAPNNAAEARPQSAPCHVDDSLDLESLG